ncbi:major capsid protein [Methylomonas sp. HYX-M1]|uniref:major capsid protein n=1 Tax=Methylomonas sp. HYX-M1 TaxID=3139307 RepID=UPI00345B5DDE
MNIKQKFAAASALTVASVSSAFAAVPTEVTDAIATAKTDAVSLGGSVLVVVVALFGLMLLRRAIK